MSGHEHEPEDETVCIKVAVFFIVVIATIFFLGIIN
jgi:hypothetical protein